MYRQKLPLRLNEINELLTPSTKHLREPEKVLNYRKHQEAEYLAEILWKLELKGRTLNRKLLSKLHSGEQKWPDEQGNYVSIAEPEFEFEVLEKLGLIYFENDWVNLTTRNLPEFSEVDGSLVPVLRFLENINQILTGKSEQSKLQQLKLQISINNFDEIVGGEWDTFTEHKVGLTLENKHYSVTIDGNGWDTEALLNQYFWNVFLDSENFEKDTKHFFALNTLFPEVFKFPHLELYDRNNLDNAKLLAKESVNTSFLLKCTLSEFVTLEETIRKFTDNLYGSSNGEEEPIKLNLSQVLEYYESLQSQDYEVERYLIQMQSYSYYYRFLRSVGHCALTQLASNNVHIDNISSYVDGTLKEFLSLVNQYPLLKFYLLHELHTINNDYPLYLLSNPNFYQSGYEMVKNKISNKYGLRNESDILISKNFIKLIAETCISSAINNDELPKLSIFLCNIIKSGNVKDNKEYSIDYNLFDEVFNQLTTDVKIFVIDNCLNYLESIEPDMERNQSSLYFMFYLLDMVCEVKSNRDVDVLYIKVNDLIFRNYKAYFEKGLNSNGYSLDKDKFYDLLSWKNLSDKLCKEMLALQPRKLELYKKLSKVNEFNKVQFANCMSNYLQILNCLVKVNSESRKKLISRIGDLVVDFGFECEDYSYPLVYDTYKSSFKEDYDLLVAISKNFKHYDEPDFRRLIDSVVDIAPLSSMLLLLENSQSQSRKFYIQNQIDNQSYESDEEGITSLESAYHSAIMTNNLDLAKLTLSQSKRFFDGHRWKENIEVKVMIYQWDIFEYKFELLSVLNSDQPLADKEKAIKQLICPKPSSEICNHHKGKAWKNEGELFERYILGLVLFNENPEKATKIFEFLKKEYPNTIFPHLYFISNIKWLETKSSTINEFKLAIKDYEDSISNFNLDSLSIGNKADYLSALYLSEQYTKVERLCDSLDIVERSYKPIALSYCRSLQKNGNDNKAKQFIDNYKLYHGLDILDEEFTKEVENIDSSILERFDDSISKKIKYQFIIGQKDNDELRTIFNEIRLAPVNDLSEILPRRKLDKDNFLYDEILACAKVIRSRVKNLEVEITKNNENLINSWIVSIFNARLSRFGISIDEQKFIGESNTKTPKTSGSADGVIMGQTNEQLALFEGLNLNTVSTSTIDSHYDKLNKYDLIGLSPMFLVSYCYFKNDFSSCVDDYIEHVETKDYYDFDRPDDHKLEVLSKTSTKHLVTALEYRNRGDQRIAIYHILIDMKLPSQEKN
ncbi:hypothetical protein ACU5DF_01465 [Aliivibrio wodanis]|uniref:hypothetical protein n=1 Tax=Aliivibrio wodanis TaxID=80852 RepID=UPI00406C6730